MEKNSIIWYTSLKDGPGKRLHYLLELSLILRSTFEQSTWSSWIILLHWQGFFQRKVPITNAPPAVGISVKRGWTCWESNRSIPRMAPNSTNSNTGLTLSIEFWRFNLVFSIYSADRPLAFDPSTDICSILKVSAQNYHPNPQKISMNSFPKYVIRHSSHTVCLFDLIKKFTRTDL